MNPLENRYNKAEELYCSGYLTDLEYSPYTRRALADGAKEDFSRFIFGVEEAAAEKAYDDGYSAVVYDNDQLAEKQELLAKQQKLQIAKLQKELDEKDSIALAELSFYLGQSFKANATPTHDVELWAYQDGWNEVIQLLMKKIAEINTSKSVTPK